MSESFQKIKLKGKDTLLVDHIRDIIKFISIHQPSTPLEHFSQISNYLSSGKYIPNKPVNYFIEEESPKYLFREIEDFQRGYAVKNYLKNLHDKDSVIIKPEPEATVDKKTKPKTEDDDEDEEPEASQENDDDDETDEDFSALHDLISDFNSFRDAGVSLSEEEILKLYLSMSELQKVKKFQSIRFFGKVFGVKNDYYIIETLSKGIKEDTKDDDDDEEEEEGEDDKKKVKKVKKEVKRIKPETAKGTNKYKYYVCTTLEGHKYEEVVEVVKEEPKKPEGEEEEVKKKVKKVVIKSIERIWIELPDVLPEQILEAKKIKKYFTGDLEAKIDCHPPYPGLEKNYLRAQIARITSATVLAPKGLFKTESENEEGGEDEEMEGESSKSASEKQVVQRDAYYELPEVSVTPDFSNSRVFRQLDLDKIENWIHLYPAILHKEGRCETLMKPVVEEDEDNDNEAKPKKKEKPDVEQVWPLLSPISMEEKINGSDSWCVHKLLTEFEKNYVCLKSLRWPGAFCFGKKDSKMKFNSVYLGYGVKNSRISFSPQITYDVSEEVDTLCLSKDTSEYEKEDFVIAEKTEKPTEQDE